MLTILASTSFCMGVRAGADFRSASPQLPPHVFMPPQLEVAGFMALLDDDLQAPTLPTPTPLPTPTTQPTTGPTAAHPLLDARSTTHTLCMSSAFGPSTRRVKYHNFAKVRVVRVLGPWYQV